ncbi:MAG: hypothetical protein AAF206_03505 [Bacteroidota bacterium]
MRRIGLILTIIASLATIAGLSLKDFFSLFFSLNNLENHLPHVQIEGANVIFQPISITVENGDVVINYGYFPLSGSDLDGGAPSAQTPSEAPATFQYEISGYAPGKYRMSEDADMQQFVTGMRDQLGQFVKKHYSDGMKLDISVIGSADGLNVKPNTIYRGEWNLGTLSYYSENEKRRKERLYIPNSTMLMNEDYAVLRAVDMYTEMTQHNDLKDMEKNVNITAHVYKEVGELYRKSAVEVRIVNAVNLDNLNELERLGVEKIILKQ